MCEWLYQGPRLVRPRLPVKSLLMPLIPISHGTSYTGNGDPESFVRLAHERNSIAYAGAPSDNHSQSSCIRA